MSRKLSLVAVVAGCLLLGSCGPKDQDVRKPKLKSFKYVVEGPWNIGAPVHETLALLSLRTAIEKHKCEGILVEGVSVSHLPAWDSTTAHNMNARKANPSVQQFLRGVLWPDDPEGLFFKTKTDTKNFSTGWQWRAAFKGKATDRRNLTARSHFGDLQYLHAMSPTPSMARRDVQDKMLTWAGFLVDVAAGRIQPGTALSTIPSVAGHYPGRPGVRELFVAAPSSTDLHVRQRAFGALLHLVQDSYAQGHTQRAGDGRIVAFHCYSDPAHDRNEHAIHDKWGSGATLRDHVANTPGAMQAVDKGARLLALVNAGAPRAEILRFLKTDVLPLASP